MPGKYPRRHGATSWSARRPLSAFSLLAMHPSVASREGYAIRPFSVHIPEADLADLRRRIAAVRWPDQETVNDDRRAPSSQNWRHSRYWGTGYDWRKVEANMNALPKFITEIDGVDIHFIHVRSKHANALPLIVTHGWPGSIIELLKILARSPIPRRMAGTHRTLSSRPPVDARLWLFRQTEGEGLGPRAHRSRLGRVDEAPRIHALCRPRWRLGVARFECDGAPGAGRVDWHPHQLAGDRAARDGRGDRCRRARTGGALREGARRVQLLDTFVKMYSRPTAIMGTRPQTIGYSLAGLSRRARGVDARASRLFSLDYNNGEPERSRPTTCSTTSRCIG